MIDVRALFSKRSIRIFLLWYLCLVLIAGTVVTAVHVKTVSEEKGAYEAALRNQVQALADYYGLIFRSTIDSSNGIFQARWYKHYRNVAQLYSDEFDGMRRLEIMEELRSKMAASAFVIDILVITPPPLGTVITPNGWHLLEDYERIYGTVRIEFQEDYKLPPLIAPAEDTVCTIVLQDSTPRLLQGVVCILVDTRSFANLFRRSIPEQAGYVRVLLGEQILFQSGAPSEAWVTNEASVGAAQLTMVIGSRRYEDALLPARNVSFALIMTIVLLAGAIVSGGLTWALMQPLHRIIRDFGGNVRQVQDPYRFIEGYLEAFARNNAQLRREKEGVERSMSEFLAQMRNEILFGILTDPDVDLHSRHVRSCVPWLHHGLPCLLVLIKSDCGDEARRADTLPFQALAEQAQHACVFPILYNDLCLMLWYAQGQDAREHRRAAEGWLQKTIQDPTRYAVSEILAGPQQLQAAYRDLNAQLTDRRSACADLPLPVQVRLFDLCMKNKAEACEAYLEENQASIDLDALLRFFMRIALEYQVDAKAWIVQYQRGVQEQTPQVRRQALRDLARELCRAIQAKRSAGMNDTAELIRRFVDEHYQDPCLSMQQLSDRFGMHRTLISKLLKPHLGMTFSEYLQALRIQRARELLRSGQMSMACVAQAVGYTNYATFKRAFVRHQGKPPREYLVQ